jgi:hypothetical protein
MVRALRESHIPTPGMWGTRLVAVASTASSVAGVTASAGMASSTEAVAAAGVTASSTEAGAAAAAEGRTASAEGAAGVFGAGGESASAVGVGALVEAVAGIGAVGWGLGAEIRLRLAEGVAEAAVVILFGATVTLRGTAVVLGASITLLEVLLRTAIGS